MIKQQTKSQSIFLYASVDKVCTQSIFRNFSVDKVCKLLIQQLQIFFRTMLCTYYLQKNK